MSFSTRLDENMTRFNELLDVNANFDVVCRTTTVGGRNACIYFVDGFTKDEVLLKIMQIWESMKPEAMPENARDFSKQYVPYGEVGLTDKEEDVILQLLTGISCIFIDGYDHCLTLDCRT